MIHRKDLFEFMLKQVRRTGSTHGDRLPQAFGRWFSTMYFHGVTQIQIPDGASDGKIDLLATCQVGRSVKYKILNTKFTEKYDEASKVSFYDEITRYWQAFENRENRQAYLHVVREALHPYFKRLFKLYDDGHAKLYFVTNHRINEAHYASVKGYGVEVLHLDDVLQYVAEHIEGAMPETEPLLLTGIQTVLTPATNESEVPTSIVFARLIDFIDYMEGDPFDLLFARNVRLWLEEFAFSNNGITILCKKHTHDPGQQELRLENPRVVNGSQTLHSIREVANPSRVARVMTRIIEVPTGGSNELPEQLERRKEVVHKISVRSNQQNPIKRWNLVANDDFQNELSRYFWDHRLYYERRQGEWKYRKLELTSVGIRRGPGIRWMTQLIASYYYDRRKLGPAVARARLNELYDEEPYSQIRNTTPTLAYQLYLLGEINDRALRRLASKKQYIANAKGYIDLASFATLCRLLREGGVKLGREDTGRILEHELAEDDKTWTSGVKGVVDSILDDFKKASQRSSRDTGSPISLANYFKATSLVGEYFRKPLPKVRALLGRFA